MDRCKRLWVVERVTGAILIEKGRKIISGQVKREECERQCLTENDFECKSINFQTGSQQDVGKVIFFPKKTTRIYL